MNDVKGNPEPGTPGYREWRSQLEAGDGKHTVKIKAELTFELVEGEALKADEWMGEAEILLDAFAAEVGRKNTANPPLRLCFAEGVIYECQLVDEA